MENLPDNAADMVVGRFGWEELVEFRPLNLAKHSAEISVAKSGKILAIKSGQILAVKFWQNFSR